MLADGHWRLDTDSLGIRESFEDLVRMHQAAVSRTMLRLTGDRETVEDLTQEVFLRLYRALPGFRGEAQISTYLYRITVNVAQDAWKRRRRVERPLRSLSDEEAGWEDRLRHPGRNAEEVMGEREFAEAVDRELQRLSDVERAVLVLYHQEQQSYGEIAAALGMPVNTVRTHLHRARHRLREALRGVRESTERRVR